MCSGPPWPACVPSETLAALRFQACDGLLDLFLCDLETVAGDAGNDAARGFYLRQGFSHVAERTFHVGGKAYDDHVLALRLGT